MIPQKQNRVASLSFLRPVVACVALLGCIADAPASKGSMMGSSSNGPKFIREARAYWWSTTKPEQETFELPSAVGTCSLIKARFLGEVYRVSSRTGAFPANATVVVEDNFGDARYLLHSEIQVDFYLSYDNVAFGGSRISGVRAIHVDREDNLTLLDIHAAAVVPDTPLNYICVFQDEQKVMISYFLRKSERKIWAH
jgi:type IV secretory pathway TraG/TraD family ATPase VirD4